MQPNNEQRFNNILSAAEFTVGDTDMERMIRGDEEVVDLDVLLADLRKDYIPRYLLIGYGDGEKWGTFRYIDDLSHLPEVATAMHDETEEISVVQSFDLDNNGVEVEEFSLASWEDYWYNDEDEDEWDDQYDD